MRTKMGFKACILFFLTVAAVSGCSGGGGSSKNPPPQTGSGPGSSVDDSPLRPAPPTVPAPVPPLPVPDNTPTPAPTPVPTDPTPLAGTLLITEFNHLPFYSIGGQNTFGITGEQTSPWFEVYNSGDTPVLLSEYTLRSSWRLVPRPGHPEDYRNPFSAEPIEFELPAVSVPPKGYMVIVARKSKYMQDTRQAVYVSKENRYPEWGAGKGSIELLRAGQTVDFVRIGESTATPQTRLAWSGPSIANPGDVRHLGSTFVRPMPYAAKISNSAEDWVLAHFATPGGPNDVAQNAADADSDGIPDSAEVPGGTYAGLDLYALGARAGRKDIFIEFDYATYQAKDLSTDELKTYSYQPHEASLRMVAAAFAKKNIAVHFDVGAAYSSTFNPAMFNLGGGNPIPTEVNNACIDFKEVVDEQNRCLNFKGVKSQYLDIRRRYIFHYGLHGRNIQDERAIGIAELSGNDMAYAFSTWTNGQGMQEKDFNKYVNGLASLIMHELGHNLGLNHGGHDDHAYKPNHHSVMNYTYSYLGLSPRPNGPDAWRRYRFDRYGGDECAMENSVCSESFIIDYSDGSGLDIDERNVSEALNIGRGSIDGAYADWDNNGVLTQQPYSFRFHIRISDLPLQTLKDYDEWSNLKMPYSVAGRAADRNEVGIDH